MPYCVGSGFPGNLHYATRSLHTNVAMLWNASLYVQGLPPVAFVLDDVINRLNDQRLLFHCTIVHVMVHVL